MKKQILIICLATVSTLAANAQISKGSILLGANVGIGSGNSSQSTVDQTNPNSSSSSSNNSLVFTPSVGYFFANNFAVGVSAGYSQSTTKYGADQTSSTNSSSSLNHSFSFSPYVRYYFPLGEKAAIYTQLGLGYAYNFGSNENTYSNQGVTSIYSNKTEGTTYTVSLFPGFSYFVSNKFAMEVSIGSLYYSATKGTTTPDISTGGGSVLSTTSSGLGLNLTTSSVLFGFKYYIRKA